MQKQVLRSSLVALLLTTSALASGGSDVLFAEHRGPAVASGGMGEERAARLLAEFDTHAALDAAAVADTYDRSVGGEGYRAVLDHFSDRLRDAGFGRLPGFELRRVETPLAQASWTGRAANLSLIDAKGYRRVLHAFDRPDSEDRAMLPVHAPAANLTGDVVFSLADLAPGDILVTRSRVRSDLLRRALKRGAAAVVSASLETFNVDFSGSSRLLDAIQLRELPADTPLPVFQISLRSYLAIADERGAQLQLRADVRRGPSRTETLVALIEGDECPEEVAALVAHLQGGGASDNAAAAAGMLEAARTSARLIQSGKLARPRRSLAFVFGPEWTQVQSWLAETELVPIAAIGVLGIGTGAGELLFERSPDPGSSSVLGAEWMHPNGLSVLARCSLADIAAVSGDWQTAESAYEGGANPDAFLAAGIPAVLFWSSPSSLSRTSLDRWQHIDAEKLRRGSTAALATAWAVADPAPEDLSRYRASLELERRTRQAEELARGRRANLDWSGWFEGAAHWLGDTGS